MCTYCMMADWMRDYTTPASPVQPWTPWTPLPTMPQPPPWSFEQLQRAIEILRQVREMQDKIGVCTDEDPSKMAFLQEMEAQFAQIERKTDESHGEAHPVSE